jgi:ParB family transcriptional regulator, chromosome partitioning protein
MEGHSVTEQTVVPIPIAAIHIANPRSRNRIKWQLVVQSIATVGLKRPITVAKRLEPNADGKSYDLVCGQGRMEAFIELGETTIPAIIVEALEQDRQLMSLVENIARRPSLSRAILAEVRSLRERGNSREEIAFKLGLDRAYLYGICHLIDKSEEFLVASVEAGRIPLSVAVEIASGNDDEVSKALSDAYEKGDLRGTRITAARRIITQRVERQKLQGQVQRVRRKLTGEALVQEYKQKIREQTALVVKANRTRDRLILLTSAARILFADENFCTLLKAEGMQDMPAELAERLSK